MDLHKKTYNEHCKTTSLTNYCTFHTRSTLEEKKHPKIRICLIGERASIRSVQWKSAIYTVYV